MTDAAVFSGSIGTVKTVPSRGVVSITIEAPIEQHADIAQIAVHGVWVAVARLQQQPVKQEAKPTNREAQKAGILCSDMRFHAFLYEKYEAAQGYSDKEKSQISSELVREICNVDSRANLTRDNDRWNQLQAEYELWLRT